MARSEWSAARPGGHDDTARSVTSRFVLASHTHRRKSGLRRMDVAGETRGAPPRYSRSATASSLVRRCFSRECAAFTSSAVSVRSALRYVSE